MRGAAIKSALLHLFVVALAWYGLPQLFDDPPIGERVIVVEMVEIAEQRNLPREIIEQPEEPEPEAEPTPPEPETAELEPPPPPPPAEQAPPPPPEIAAPEPKPDPAPAPEPEPEPEVAKADPLPDAIPKPQPKPERAPEPEPEPEPDQVAQLPTDVSRPKRKPEAPEARIDFDRALESLDDEELPQALPVEPAPEAPQPERQVDDAIEQLLAAADTPHRVEAPLSMTEIDSIRTQIQKNWNVPAGAQDAHTMIVKLRIQLGPDGTVRSVDVVEKERMNSEPFFRTMAESAVRAVKKTGQIKYLSPNKYHLWRDITVNFDPRDMFS